jgi:hypothetical protein
MKERKNGLGEIWNLKFICEYWDLSVNTDNVIVNMDFESVYDPTFVMDVEEIKEKVDKLADAVATLTTSTSIRDTLKLKQPIDDIYVDAEGKVVVNGEPLEEDFDRNTLIQDADGKEYVATSDGNIMGKEEFAATGGNSRLMDNFNKEKEAKAQPDVTFTASQQQKYGFDAYNGF